MEVATPEFHYEKHVEYIKKVASDVDSFEYLVTQYLRMSGVYWGMTAMRTLGKDLTTQMNQESIVQWVISCQDLKSGGFGGNIDHDPHLLYTLSALQILLLCDQLHRINQEIVISYISSLQKLDGSFMGDRWGEVDTRFSYCALSSLSILGQLHSGVINLTKAVDFVTSCKNFDGGYGAVPGAESHAGQIFCCVGALSIAESLDQVDADLLGWWLSERQCDSGGLNGRPEKQADVCYSWWILSSLSILGRVSWIDKEKLAMFIYQAQDKDDGGIADRPGNMADIFHTFFGISGLSLLGHFKAEDDSTIRHCSDSSADNDNNSAISIFNFDSNNNNSSSSSSSNDSDNINNNNSNNTNSILPTAATATTRINPNSRFPCLDINPTYALPEEVVSKYKLRFQMLPNL